MFLFDTKKEPKKCPLLPIAREARPRGCSPLGTPKRRVREKNPKKCRSAAFFLTDFFLFPHCPLRGQNDSMGVELMAPLEGSSAVRRVKGGRVAVRDPRTTPQSPPRGAFRRIVGASIARPSHLQTTTNDSPLILAPLRGELRRQAVRGGWPPPLSPFNLSLPQSDQ